MATIIKQRKLKPSSRAWVTRQLKDPFVKQARAHGYRARSAFKLLELDKKCHLLRPRMRVIDLGSSPGGWLQVLVEKIAPPSSSEAVGQNTFPSNSEAVGQNTFPSNSEAVGQHIAPPSSSEAVGQHIAPPSSSEAVGQHIAPPSSSEAVGRNTPPYIIGIDLLPLDPVPPAYIMTGDFTKAEIQDKLVRQLQGKKCDGVLSDMASNTTGHQGTDHLRTLLLAEVAFDFACQHLGKGGFFVCKVFQGGAGGELLTAMKKKFRRVDHIKPSASRKESPELYLVARGFRG